MIDNSNIRVVVVDDHALFRAGLINILVQTPGIEIVGEGSHGKEAERIVRDNQPDVILLDVNIPVLNGEETVKRIKQISRCRILMLTISQREEDLMGAIRSGADGYILKNSDPKEFYNAIKRVITGK
jgi:DNA-binding NarL/FixJ family response regulator